MIKIQFSNKCVGGGGVCLFPKFIELTVKWNSYWRACSFANTPKNYSRTMVAVQLTKEMSFYPVQTYMYYEHISRSPPPVHLRELCSTTIPELTGRIRPAISHFSKGTFWRSVFVYLFFYCALFVSICQVCVYAYMCFIFVYFLIVIVSVCNCVCVYLIRMSVCVCVIVFCVLVCVLSCLFLYVLSRLSKCVCLWMCMHVICM